MGQEEDEKPGLTERETRILKAQQLRKKGINPYPYRYDITSFIGPYREIYGPRLSGPSTSLEDRIRLAGRLMAKRRYGKLSFGELVDQSGSVQMVVERATVGDENYQLFSSAIDLGDIVGVDGVPMRTKTGELSVKAREVQLLTKAISPFPDKWEGVRDEAIIYRNRSLYLMMNPEAREIFIRRSQAVKIMREHFDRLGFMEVEIPTLQPVYGGASARPFKTHVNALDADFYLSISPELYLKRLVAGNFFNGVYTICKNFRNEGIDRSHNPEFTMMEVYRAFWDYTDMMRLTENVWAEIFERVRGTTKVGYRALIDKKPTDVELDFTPPWRRATMLDLVQEHTGIDAGRLDKEGLVAAMKEKYHDGELGADGDFYREHSWGELVQELFGTFVESRLIQPTIVIDHPLESTPLCKGHRGDSRLIERFEPFVAGIEVANAYSELNDPVRQRELLEEQAAKGRAGDPEAHHMDEEFLAAIELGIPPTGGLGIGIDRLMMFLAGAETIRDVIAFPLVRTTERTKRASDKVGIAVLGYGMIGTEVINHFKEHDEIEIRHVLVRDTDKERPHQMPITTDLQAILDDDTVKVVVELMEGNTANQAYQAIRAAIERGKSVVTANKAVMAEYLVDLLHHAREQGVTLRFEASVGGSIPIIRTINDNLRHDEITEMTGILSSTCNFILSSMIRGMSFEDALQKAKDERYAEPDPLLDINGVDASRKLAILGSLAFSHEVLPTSLYRCGLVDDEGRQLLDPADFVFAREHGYMLKLASHIALQGNTIVGGVFPALVPADHALATIHGIDNGIVVYGKKIGRNMYTGPSAGAEPTASAVISDVYDAVARSRKGFPPTYNVRQGGNLAVGLYGLAESAGYIRSYSPDEPGSLMMKMRILSEAGVNVDSAHNMPDIRREADGETPDFIGITPTSNAVMDQVMSKFREAGIHDTFFLRVLKNR